MTRTDLLNYLIDRYGYKTYLEIGVDDSTNFNAIRVEKKWGVDPICPAKFQITSDQFFSKNWPEFHYDLIFIDGLHEEEQVIRDIENALQNLAKGGTIVVHDCNPLEEGRASEKRGANAHWNGTVWKAWVRTRASHDDLRMYVLDLDEGCGIIQVDTKEFFSSPKLPENLDWDWLRTHRVAALNLVTFDEWKMITENMLTGINLFQYWDVNPPEDVSRWMESWKKNHASWNYKRFDEESAREFLRNETGSRSLAAYDACRVPASKSNVFRYAALWALGGVWADADLECVASVDALWAGAQRGIVIREARPMPALAIAGYSKPVIGETEIRNDFLLFKKPGDKLLEKMLGLSLMNIETTDGSGGTSWNFTGPGIWCDLYKRDERAFEGMRVMWYHDVVEWKYREHEYKKGGGHWTNVRKGTPIFGNKERA